MSDTTDPQGGAEPAAPAPEIEAPAPAETSAATEPETPAELDPPKPSRTDRRIAALSARLSAGEQERARLAQEVEQYRRQGQPQPDKPITAEDIPRIVEERVAAQLAQRVAAERAEQFHASGKATFSDWQDRCQSLMQMGADAGFAELLIETPGGAKVAGALADDPEELERITGLKSERARAIALGRYAAALETREPQPKPANKLPPPIRPISGATARTPFNEATASAQQLVDFYSKQAMQKRGL
jgi:hypothetical protein